MKPADQIQSLQKILKSFELSSAALESHFRDRFTTVDPKTWNDDLVDFIRGFLKETIEQVSELKSRIVAGAEIDRRVEELAGAGGSDTGSAATKKDGVPFSDDPLAPLEDYD